MRDNTLRVQSGNLRGKVLRQPKTSGTRPTKSIVKACVLNVLRSELAESEFIEAFGGSASMAIEAISNGAIAAHVCELNREALECARENCRGLNISVHAGDALRLLEGLIRQVKERGNKVILYLDPPFACRKGFDGIYEKLRTAADGSDIVVVEHESATDIRLSGFIRESVRKFGRTSVSFFRACADFEMINEEQ